MTALTIVGTPIGNVDDMTERARQCLIDADVVCAEDTRRTRRLLSALDVHARRLVSIRAANEVVGAERVLGWLREGLSVAYVTDAGMPVVSDPGARLAAAVVQAGLPLRVVGGPDAPTTAMLLSGFPMERWCFDGFLPRRRGDRRRALERLLDERRPVVVFEAPHRLLDMLADVVAVLGGARQIVVANDMTKQHETVTRGPAAAVLAQLAEREPRGEFAVVVGGRL